MNVKFKAQRPGSSSPSVLAGQIRKKPGDKFFISMDYAAVLPLGDYIATCTLTATDLDDTDVASTLLANTGGPPPNADLITGTPTGGSTTSLINTAVNFAILGVQAGDKVLITGSGKATIATIKAISTTTNPYDTLEFETLPFTVTSSETYRFLFATAIVQAGTSATVYKVTWTMTSNAGRIFTDSALVNVLS